MGKEHEIYHAHALIKQAFDNWQNSHLNSALKIELQKNKKLSRICMAALHYNCNGNFKLFQQYSELLFNGNISDCSFQIFDDIKLNYILQNNPQLTTEKQNRKKQKKWFKY